MATRIGSALGSNHQRRSGNPLLSPFPPRKSHPVTGRNLLEIMWELIDQAMNVLMSPEADEMFPAEHREHVGYALGLATMYATFVNPYQPDIDAVRHEAVARWEERQ